MIAAALIAASALTPAGATAGIQADPVCLPVTAQPGHSYPLTVYVSGSSPLSLAVTPAHGSLERRLHQVPSSWARFSSNPAGPGRDALTLSIPDGAVPGAYWSDINAWTQGQAGLGSGATAAIVLTVGPSATPPPPCDALDLAQSTGKFPAWPTKAFATSSWKQVFAREKRDEPAPYLSPTASPGNASSHPAAPAARYAPASPAASQRSSNGKGSLIGWGALGAVVLYVIIRRKRRRS